MLINLSNHPLETWSEKQIEQANLQFGEIYNISFPAINPKCSAEEVIIVAHKYLNKIKEILTNHFNKNNAVHLMGEFTFVFALASLLIEENFFNSDFSLLNI